MCVGFLLGARVAGSSYSWIRLIPVFPILHHRIDTLPEDHQPIVKLLYTQWLALAATLIINLLGCIFLLIAGASEGG